MNELVEYQNQTLGEPKTYEINPVIREWVRTSEHSICLNDKEQRKIESALKMEAYDMATEYVWSRTINILRDKISLLGNDLIGAMLGYNSFASVRDIPEESVIDLCADIQLINNTARLKLKSHSELIYHLQKRDIINEEEEEIEQSDSIAIIADSIKYVLSESESKEFIPFNDTIRNLQSMLLQVESPFLSRLVNSPYFYIRTVSRVIIKLAKDPQNPTPDVTMQNTTFILKTVWEKLDEREKWNIGIEYSLAVSEGNSALTNALRIVLNSKKGFDYVPETTKSDTYRKTARHLLAKHNEFNNFYNEPEVANLLANMGTSIPKGALIECLTAVIICRLGNPYGISNAAVPYLDEILKSISMENWVYFLNELPTNQDVLYELGYIKRGTEIMDIWHQIVTKYRLNTLSVNSREVSELIRISALSDRYKEAKSKAKEMYDKIIN